MVTCFPIVSIAKYSKNMHYLFPQFFLKSKWDIVCPSVRYAISTKFNQIGCVSYSHEWDMQGQTFFLAPPPGALGKGQKVKYHLISISKSISKIFIPNFVYVLTNERHKTYQKGFSFRLLGHAPGLGLGGTGGAQGVKKIFFPNMVIWHIKSTGMMS